MFVCHILACVVDTKSVYCRVLEGENEGLLLLSRSDGCRWQALQSAESPVLPSQWHACYFFVRALSCLYSYY